MNIKYIIISVIALGLGFGLFLMERKPHTNEILPEQLLTEIADDARFISTDELAKGMVNSDPSIFLIDVRSVEEYNKYSLPGAFNIPIADILNEDWQAYFEQDAKKIIFLPS